MNELFERDVRYIVPLFQRPYVWDEAEQWEPLWEDIRVLLEHQTVNGTSDAPLSHFLGAIVLEQETAGPGAIPIFTVIDGQQRLTTLQLLLAAAAAAVREVGAIDDAELLVELVRNNERKAKGDDLFKVWPTNANRAAFAAVMAPEGPPDDREDDPETRIDEAYAYFRAEISAWLAGAEDDGGMTIDERARLVRVTLVDLLKVVSITLESGDNAQVIFETLNARGTPLLALDLVKNSVFRAISADGDDAEALYEKRWKPVLDDDYWREMGLQGRLRRPRGEHFLMHWLGMKLRRVIPATELFTVFRREILSAESDHVADLIAEVCRDATTMRGFDALNPATPEARFFARLDVLDTSTVLPLALLLFRDASIDPVRRRRALAAVESWLVRRGLMRFTAQRYNIEVPALVARVAEQPDRADEAVIDHLRSRAGQASRWPDDAEFGEFLGTQRLYGLVARKRLVMALTAVEESLQTAKTDLGPAAGLSLEHVMPQRWQTNWPLPADALPEAAAERMRNIHRLGNLTLTALPLNAALSNSAWPRKQQDLNAHSRLLLNVDLVAQYAGGFDEQAIDERSTWMAEALCRIWPGPDSEVWATSLDLPRPQTSRFAAKPTSVSTFAQHSPDPAPAAPPPSPTPPIDVAPPPDSGPVRPRRRATLIELDTETAIRLVKAHHEYPRLKGKALHDAFGLDIRSACLALYSTEPLVYPHIALEATPEDVAAAREGTLPRSRLIEGEHPQLRWDRIAERAGITLQEARELYEGLRGPGSARRSYTGLGRKFDDMD